MCLIVDINVAERVLIREDDKDLKDVHTALFTTTSVPAKMVIGGDLTKEYANSPNLMRIVLALDRAGRVKKVPGELVDAECAKLKANQSCKSNDMHIVALARVSRTRLLCSNDEALHHDFTNPALISRPRGKIFQYAEHKPLLIEFCGS